MVIVQVILTFNFACWILNHRTTVPALRGKSSLMGTRGPGVPDFFLSGPPPQGFNERDSKSKCKSDGSVSVFA